MSLTLLPPGSRFQTTTTVSILILQILVFLFPSSEPCFPLFTPVELVPCLVHTWFACFLSLRINPDLGTLWIFPSCQTHPSPIFLVAFCDKKLALMSASTFSDATLTRESQRFVGPFLSFGMVSTLTVLSRVSH